MLNKFLFGLLLTSSLAVLSPANAMEKDDMQYKTAVRFEDGEVTIPYGTSANIMLKIQRDMHDDASSEGFIKVDPSKSYSLSGSVATENSVNVLSSTNGMEMKDEIEKKSSFASQRISALETVKFDNGHLSLTDQQLLNCRFIDILKTQVGRFSVSPGNTPRNTNFAFLPMIDPYCNGREFSSVESDGKFEFSFNTLKQFPGIELIIVPYPHIIFLKKI